MNDVPIRDNFGCFIKGSPGPHQLQLDRNQVRKLYEELKSTYRVAHVLGYSQSGVLYFMRREGLELKYKNSSLPWPRRPQVPRKHKKVQKNCTICGKIAWQRIDSAGKHPPVCSTNCRSTLHSEQMSGVLHPNWRGGLTTLLKRIRTSRQYRLWMQLVLERDQRQCRNCNSKINPCVHHIIPLVRIIREEHITTIEEARACERLWNPANGTTLCEECHRAVGVIRARRRA